MAYWLGRDWWGIGPGAHSHVNGTRWWNVKHPATYRGRLAEGRLPVEDHEVLDAEQRHEETVLLQLRLADGLPLSQLTEVERHRSRDLGQSEAVTWYSTCPGEWWQTGSSRICWCEAIARVVMPSGSFQLVMHGLSS